MTLAAGSSPTATSEVRPESEAAGAPAGPRPDTVEERLRQAQKMEAIGRLAGGVAHDFNNLLTVINGYSELLLADLRPGDPLREFIEQIAAAGGRGAALTRQLLTFSRKQVVVPELLDPNRLLRDMEKMLVRL